MPVLARLCVAAHLCSTVLVREAPVLGSAPVLVASGAPQLISAQAALVRRASGSRVRTRAAASCALHLHRHPAMRCRCIPSLQFCCSCHHNGAADVADQCLLSLLPSSQPTLRLQLAPLQPDHQCCTAIAAGSQPLLPQQKSMLLWNATSAYHCAAAHCQQHRKAGWRFCRACARDSSVRAAEHAAAAMAAGERPKGKAAARRIECTRASREESKVVSRAATFRPRFAETACRAEALSYISASYAPSESLTVSCASRYSRTQMVGTAVHITLSIGPPLSDVRERSMV